MVGLKLKNFSSEGDQFERLLMVQIKLKIVFLEDEPFLAVINGRNEVEKSLFRKTTNFSHYERSKWGN